MSFLDNYKQGNIGNDKRFWNVNLKNMMSLFDAYKQGGSVSIWNFRIASAGMNISGTSASEKANKCIDSNI